MHIITISLSGPTYGASLISVLFTSLSKTQLKILMDHSKKLLEDYKKNEKPFNEIIHNTIRELNAVLNRSGEYTATCMIGENLVSLSAAELVHMGNSITNNRELVEIEIGGSIPIGTLRSILHYNDVRENIIRVNSGYHFVVEMKEEGSIDKMETYLSEMGMTTVE